MKNPAWLTTKKALERERERESQNLYVGVGSDSQNPSIANRHGIGEGKRVVAGVYHRIGHHQLGRHGRPQVEQVCKNRTNRETQ